MRLNNYIIVTMLYCEADNYSIAIWSITRLGGDVSDLWSRVMGANEESIEAYWVTICTLQHVTFALAPIETAYGICSSRAN